MEATLSLVIISLVLPRLDVDVAHPRAGSPQPLLRNCSISFSDRHPRPHRGELDTMGRDDRPMAPAISGRRLAHDRREGPAECPQAREGDVETDVRDTPIALAQQEHGALHPAA